MNKVNRKWRRVKQKIYKWLMPEDDYRAFLMSRAGFTQEPPLETKTISTQVVLDERSHEFLHCEEGKLKYDATYGLTRQLADQLKEYVQYTESYDEEFKEWTCRVSLKVVVE